MIEYKLNEPIRYNGEVIDKIDLHEPKLAHFKKIEKLNLKGDFESSAKLIELLSEKPEGFIDQLSMIDVASLRDLLEPYLKKSQPTSGNA